MKLEWVVVLTWRFRTMQISVWEEGMWDMDKSFVEGKVIRYFEIIFMEKCH